MPPDQEQKMKATASRERTTQVRIGATAPLGATVTADGVNFSVFSKHATGIDLLLFDPRRGILRVRPARRRTRGDGCRTDCEPDLLPEGRAARLQGRD